MGWTTTLTGKARNVTIDGGGNGTFTGGASAKSAGLNLLGHIQHSFSGDSQRHINLEMIRAGGTELDPWIGLSGDELTMDSVKATGTLGQVVDFIRLTGERSRLSDWWVETNRHGLVLSGAIRNVITDWYMSVGSQADNTWDGINLTTSDYNLIDGIQVVGDGGVADPRCGVNITDAASNDNKVGVVHAPDAQTAPICNSGTDTLLAAVEKPWQTWTPTYSSIVVGNGTVTARYTQIGKTVIAHFELVLGTTSVIGTNARTSYPVAPAASYNDNEIGLVNMLDTTGGTSFSGRAHTGGTRILLSVGNTSSTYLSNSQLAAAVPFTWATGDTLQYMVIYEAA